MARDRKPKGDPEKEAAFLQNLGYRVLMRCMALGLSAHDTKTMLKRMRRALGLKS